MKNKVFFEKEGHTRKLVIRSISVHDDGEYTCSLGDQECTAEVNVIGTCTCCYVYVLVLHLRVVELIIYA